MKGVGKERHQTATVHQTADCALADCPTVHLSVLGMQCYMDEHFQRRRWGQFLLWALFASSLPGNFFSAI